MRRAVAQRHDGVAVVVPVDDESAATQQTHEPGHCDAGQPRRILHQNMRLQLHRQQDTEQLQGLNHHLRHIRDHFRSDSDTFHLCDGHYSDLLLAQHVLMRFGFSERMMRVSVLRLAAALALFAAVCGSRAEVIDDILSSLSRGVSFLERQHEHINLDGVVGFVILQAELKEAVRTWPHTDPVSWAQRTTAVALVRRLDQSLEKANAALEQDDPKYYREFEPLLSWSFWLIPQEWYTTDPSLVYPSTMTTECYDEQLSDKCLTLLLGTWKMNGTPCIVTKPCRDTMTRFGCPHYSLSHQLLYFMIGKMKGCTNLLKGDTRASRANMTEQNYQRIFCSNMMKTNQDIKDGLSEQMVDIFIENILICGLSGFSDFHKADWLQHILRLQDEEVGCFGRDKSIISQIIGDELLEQLQPHRRVKRREKILPDGCSSHMTAVAVGALGGYLNYYLTEQDITKRPLS